MRQPRVLRLFERLNRGIFYDGFDQINSRVAETSNERERILRIHVLLGSSAKSKWNFDLPPAKPPSLQVGGGC